MKITNKWIDAAIFFDNFSQNKIILKIKKGIPYPKFKDGNIVEYMGDRYELKGFFYKNKKIIGVAAIKLLSYKTNFIYNESPNFNLLVEQIDECINFNNFPAQTKEIICKMIKNYISHKSFYDNKNWDGLK